MTASKRRPRADNPLDKTTVLSTTVRKMVFLAIAEEAREKGKTVSGVVRDILEQARPEYFK